MPDTGMTVLVVGAAGPKAGLVVPALARRGVRVRALIRRPEQEAQVRAAGAVEVAIGDLRDRDSLDRAMAGAEGLSYIAPAFQPDEVELGRGAVAAAKQAGVRRIVFSGVINPMITAMSNHADKLPVEEAITESGLEFVLLQPAMFFQTLAPSWPKVIETGVFAEPWSASSRLSRVDYRDVADAISIAMTDDATLYGTFQLAAAGLFDRHEVAALMGEALGRRVVAGTIDPAEALKAIGSTGSQAEGRRRMFAWYDGHSAPGNPLPLRAVLGREPRSFEAFLRELAARDPSGPE